MRTFKSSRVVEMDGLLSFFEATGQTDVNLFGVDVNVLFWGLDNQKKEILFSRGFEEIYGFRAEDVEGEMLWTNLFHPESVNAQKAMVEAYRNRRPIDVTYKILKKDGSPAWVQTKGNPVFNSQGVLLRYNGFTIDVTQTKMATIKSEEAALKYKTLVENNAQAVYITQQARFQYINKQMADMTGYEEQELLNMNYGQLLDENGKKIALQRVEFFLIGERNDCQEITLIKKDGTRVIAELRSSIITYNNEPALMGTLLDITRQKKNEDMINSLAFFDTLTGLPNRNHFYEELGKCTERSSESKSKFALLFIDLDRFKSINDTYGHQMGDRVIRETGKKINELLPKEAFMARYGSDEFIVIFPFTEKTEVETVVEKVIDDVPQLSLLDVSIAPTIGISYFPEHTVNPEDLIRFADIAMYRSKRNENRKQNYLVYDESFTSHLMKTNKLINDFQKALLENQFHLVYQPKMDLQTKRIEGVEALIRWEHPELGNIPPVEFIPLAEKSGKIVAIGDWVLRQSIRKIKELSPNLVLNVNISAHQLLQEDFLTCISSILRENEFDPRKLNLEITESVALYDVNKTVEVLHHLVDMGIKLSLDDFGTGYSSLSYLTKLPVHYLKIDRAFINGLENDSSKQTLTKSIIEVAHNLGLKVVAEGIETEEQADILKKWACETGQGYFFSKPLTYTDLKKFLEINLQCEINL